MAIDVSPERSFEELISWDGLRRWSTTTVDHTGPMPDGGSDAVRTLENLRELPIDRGAGQRIPAGCARWSSADGPRT